MTAKKLGLMLMTGVLSAMTTVGCCDKEKKTITGLQAENKALLQDKQTLQSEVASLKAREKDLLGKLDSKDTELLAASQRESQLQAELASKARQVTPPPTPVAPAPKTSAAGWDVGLHADRVSVGSDILFASGRATLSSSGRAALSRVVQTLRTTYAGMPVRVYGYTDSDPIRKTKKLWTDNLDLSANRAMAVTRYLRSVGIAADTIETVAMGQARPVASNSSRSTKAKNRRVEIVVIKQ